MIDGKELYSFRKNAVETIKVRRMNFNDKEVFDIRIFVERLDGRFTPTKKGVMLEVKSFAEFKKGIDLLEREINETEKIDDTKLSSV